MTAITIYSSFLLALPLQDDANPEGLYVAGSVQFMPGIEDGQGRHRAASWNKLPITKRVVTGHSITHGFMRTSVADTPFGWILSLRMVSALLPLQNAAMALEGFYNRMIDQVFQELHSQYNSLVWQYGDITLEMRSRDPRNNIPFIMVFNFLRELKTLAECSTVGTYEGEIISAITGTRIWFQLKITGR